MSPLQPTLFDAPSPTVGYLQRSFPEVGAKQFYRELFPEGELERKGVYTEGQYCGIAVQIGAQKVRRYSVTDDLEVIDRLVATEDFCVMSPVSYAGKSQKQSMARWLYAIVIDVDDLVEDLDANGEPSGIAAFLYQAMNGLRAMPTYIVASGTGVHLYYLLERPIALYRNVVNQLEAMRRDMVKDAWNRYVTHLYEHPQYESVTQGFRMVGTVTKNGGRVRAFRTGRVLTIEELNDYINIPTNRLVDLHYRSELTLSQAKDKYPQWYQSRVIEGLPKGSWKVKRDLYDWWKNRVAEAKYGHRYFYVMALAIYAIKCGIEEDELIQDALDLVPRLNSIKSDKPFTREDAFKACQMYNADYQTYPRKAIERITAIPIPPNKRNGRKLARHIEMVNILRKTRRDVLGEDEYRNSGRPPKRDAVLAYAREHPGATQREIAAALGMSKTTVNKWLRG